MKIKAPPSLFQIGQISTWGAALNLTSYIVWIFLKNAKDLTCRCRSLMGQSPCIYPKTCKWSNLYRLFPTKVETAQQIITIQGMRFLPFMDKCHKMYLHSTMRKVTVDLFSMSKMQLLMGNQASASDQSTQMSWWLPYHCSANMVFRSSGLHLSQVKDSSTSQ